MYTIRLPLALAIMRVLLVKAHGETLAIPLASEGVAWFVMKTPIEVSAEQVSQFMPRC